MRIKSRIAFVILKLNITKVLYGINFVETFVMHSIYSRFIDYVPIIILLIDSYAFYGMKNNYFKKDCKIKFSPIVCRYVCTVYYLNKLYFRYK